MTKNNYKKEKRALNIFKAHLKHFSGTDNKDYEELLMSIKEKEYEINLLKQMAANYVIKNNIEISSIQFKNDGESRKYSDSNYQKYMKRIEELTEEIQLIKESPIIKINNRK